MPGPCDCADEQAKDVKCCVCLDSYCWFKVLAWINMILSTIGLLGVFALMAVVGAAHDAIKNSDGKMTVNGEEIDLSVDENGNKIDWEDPEAKEAAKAGMGLLMFVLLCLVFSFVCTASFVCCDSARSRKMYAAAIFVGGLGSISMEQNGQTIVDFLLRCYWTYEMLKLAKIAEEGSQFTKM